MRNSTVNKFWMLGLALLLSLPLAATDGYFTLGYSARHKGLVGAGIAMYHNSIIGSNPAGNAWLGTQYEVNAGLFMPIRQYTVSGMPTGSPNTFGLMPETVKSESGTFILPAIGANWAIGEKSAIGFAIYGNGGMNTDYPSRPFYDQTSVEEEGFDLFGAVTQLTGVNLAQLFTEVTFAHEVAEGHSLGVSALLGYQQFEAKGLAFFGENGLSQDPTKLSANGTDNSTGFGFKVGYIGQFSEVFTFGATYQSKILMGEFEDYAGLFAENGDFDIPSWLQVGVAISPNDDWTFALDYKRIFYSGVNAINNPMDPMALFPGFIDENGNPQPNPNFVPLGAAGGAGFGWKDMDIFKLGIEYGGVENWIFRGGYSYGGQPIPESEVLFNILAPGVIEQHIGLGFSYMLPSEQSLHFSFNYALNNTVSGPNPLEEAQTIELEMQQLDFQLGFTF